MTGAWKLNGPGRRSKEWLWKKPGKNGINIFGMRSRCFHDVFQERSIYEFTGVEGNVPATTDGFRGIGMTPRRASKFSRIFLNRARRNRDGVDS